jgi:hypothetical protein
MTGLPAGETARVHNGEGEPVLSYRSFASIVGVVAALMSGVVFISGLAAVIFLAAEGRFGPAIVAIVLSMAFSGLIAMLVPPVNVAVTGHDGKPLGIAQTSRFSFPSATFSITCGEQQQLARVRRSAFSRLGRNRWTLLHPAKDLVTGAAVEETLGRALVRKVAGKFRRTLDANVVIHCQGSPAGTIVRRPDADGNVDYLELPVDAPIDRRVAVALATLVLGSEP